MRSFRHKGIIITVALILAVAIASTVIGIDSGRKIGIYTGGQEIRKYTEPETEDEYVPLFDYEMLAPFPIDMSLLVPVGWARTFEESTCTFVHRETGTAIKLQMLPYDPAINNVSEQSIASSVVSDGKTYLGYQRLTNASYELYYSDAGVTTYDYIEEVMWDREYVVRYTCICNDSYYEDMKQVFSESFNSLAWNQENPVPQGLVLYYEPVYQYEYAVPYDWYVSGSGVMAYAQNADGTASITVLPMEFAGTIQDITMDDIVAIINPDGSKNNSVISQYEVTEDRGTVTSSYTSTGNLIREKTLIYPYNGILYVETFSYMQGMIDETSVLDCLSLLRSFLNEPLQPETTESGPEEAYLDDIQDAEKEINGYFSDTDK